MSEKPVGYYSKKDKHGKQKVHPVFQSREMTHREPHATIYTVEQPHAVQVKIPERTVELKLVQVPVKDLKVTNTKDVEERSKYFLDQYKNGKTIPPILVHRLPDGSLEILDGNARAHAYQKLGVEKIPAVENSLSDTLKKIGGGIKSAARTTYHGVRGAARVVGQVAGAPAAVREQYREGKEADLPEDVKKARLVARAYRTGARATWDSAEVMRLIDLTESPDRSTRIAALGKLKMYYPQVAQVVYNELKHAKPVRRTKAS